MNSKEQNYKISLYSFKGSPKRLAALFYTSILILPLFLSLLQFNTSVSAAAPAALTVEGYIFENDDGANADSSSQQAPRDTAITDVRKGEKINLRMHLKNTGPSAIADDVALFYDKNNDRNWTKVGTGVTPESYGSACTDSSWLCENVDANTSVFSHIGATFNPVTESPWVAFQDNTNNDLVVSQKVGRNGTGCNGASTVWSCDVVDTAGGASASIVSDDKGAVKIAYASGGGDLWVADYVGTGGTGCTGANAAWNCKEILDVGDYGSTDIVLDSTGKAWMVAIDATNGDLVAAQYVSTGGTGCKAGVGDWTCQTIDNDVGLTSAGSSTEIIADNTDAISVAYSDDPTDDVRYATYVGTGGSGCTSGAWTCVAIASNTTNNFTYFGSHVAPNNSVWLTVHDSQAGTLLSLRNVGSGGDCDTTHAGSDAWECEVIDDVGTTTGQASSIAFDPNGTAWVAYHDLDSSSVNYARYVGSGGSGCTTGVWDGCNPIQDTANDNGEFTSLLFDNYGKPWVFYTTETDGDLSVATISNTAEMFVSSSAQSSTSGTSLTESHADMTSVTDSANRDDADCLTGGATWNNGRFMANSNARLTLPIGNVTPQCTEVTFTLDTSQAVPGTTYRFALAYQDGYRYDESVWRSTISTAQYPTVTVQADTDIRYSKGSNPILPDCTGSTEWGCEVILKNGTGVGRFSSITFDDKNVAWVALRDATAVNSFMVAQFVGSGGDCDTLLTSGSDKWECTVVFDNGTNEIGMTSASTNPVTGEPWFSFSVGLEGGGAGAAYIAEFVGSGGTGCTGGSTAFTCTKVMGDPGSATFGEHVELEFTNNGQPYLHIHRSSGRDTWFANYVGSGGNCDTYSGGSDAWQCAEINNTDQGGQFADMIIDLDGVPWIASWDGVSSKLHVMKYVGDGGSCSNIAWTCWDVDGVVGSVGAQNVGITVDNNNKIWVSYNETTTVGSEDLMVAEYVGSGGSGCDSSAWTCTVVSNPTGGELEHGAQSSIVVDSQGKPWVFYTVAGVPTYFNELRHARYVGSGGTGCTSSAWTGCTTIYQKNGIGRDLEAAIDMNGVPWLVSRDETSDDLRVAKLHLPLTRPSGSNINAMTNNHAADSGDLMYRISDGRSARTNVPGICGSALASLMGYCGVFDNDGSYDSIVTDNNETAMYYGSVQFTTNSQSPKIFWEGRSDVAPNTAGSAGDIVLEVYRFGTTNGWESLASDTASSNCNTGDCTLSGTPSGTPTDYFETDGSEYWVYFRVYQRAHTTSINFKVDKMSATTTSQRLRGNRVFEGGISKPFETQ
jgi:hypothetical protein